VVLTACSLRLQIIASHISGFSKHAWQQLVNSVPVCCSALRELALTFYDTRAIVVELVARLVGMGTLLGTPLYARQLAALEALQIYAPLGHGLGLRALCAQLEDRCFQVWHALCLCTAPADSQWASEAVACVFASQATYLPRKSGLA